MDLRNLYAAFATAHWARPTNTMVPASGDYGSIDNSNNCEQHVLQIPKHYTYSLVEREGVGNEGGGGGGARGGETEKRPICKQIFPL